MSHAHTTCWTLIDGAAGGDEEDRGRFAVTYRAVVTAVLEARWRSSPLAAQVEDAAQDVFLECFKAGGALGRADRGRGGFRPFLFGIVRNVASRYERAAGAAPALEDAAESIAARDGDSRAAFDRAWAGMVIRRARVRQAELAARTGPAAVRRVEVLRLRFEEGLAVREIAARFGVIPDRVHEDYKLARREFERALRDVIGFDLPEGGPEAVEAECRGLLGLLQGA